MPVIIYYSGLLNHRDNGLCGGLQVFIFSWNIHRQTSKHRSIKDEKCKILLN